MRDNDARTKPKRGGAGFVIGFLLALVLGGGIFYLWEMQGLRDTFVNRQKPEDIAALSQIEIAQAALDGREEDLGKRETEVGELREQVMSMDKEQKNKQKELDQREAAVKKMEEALTPKAKDLEQMIAIFEDMEAATAAPRVEKLYKEDPENAICVLKGVKEKWAAEVLQIIPPEEAAKIIKVLLNGYTAPTS